MYRNDSSLPHVTCRNHWLLPHVTSNTVSHSRAPCFKLLLAPLMNFFSSFRTIYSITPSIVTSQQKSVSQYTALQLKICSITAVNFIIYGIGVVGSNLQHYTQHYDSNIALQHYTQHYDSNMAFQHYTQPYDSNMALQHYTQPYDSNMALQHYAQFWRVGTESDSSKF